MATVYGIEQGALVMELVEGADLRGYWSRDGKFVVFTVTGLAPDGRFLINTVMEEATAGSSPVAGVLN